MLQDFTQEIKNTITELLREIHTAIPGKIVDYYPDKCEAAVLPYGKFKKPNGEFMDYPRLNHIPVVFSQSCGQDCAIVYPIHPGDECLILIQEQSLNTWRGSGAESNDDLRFDLTNAVAIAGLFSMPQPLAQEAQDNDRLIIHKNGHRLHIDPKEMLWQFSEAVSIRLDAAGVTVTAPTINLAATNIKGKATSDITLSASTINLNP